MYVLCAFVLHDMNVDDGGGCYGGYVGDGDGVVGCYGGLLVMVVVLVVNLLWWCWLLWRLNWLCW